MRHAVPASTLKVARRSQSAPLFSIDGDPVWPVANEAEFSLLSRFADKFGGFVAEASELRAEVNSASKGVVLVLDPHLEDDARLYAHLTSRYTRLATGSADRDAGLKLADDGSLDLSDVEILFLAPAQLTIDFLRELYASSRRFAPGLVIGRSDAKLRQHLLIRTAATRITPRRGLSLLEFSVHASGPQEFVEGHKRFGQEAAKAELRAALMAGSEILSLQTHSDGIDAFFGKTLSLCPIDHSVLAGAANRRPYCVETQKCFRHNLSLEEVIQSDYLISPSQIAGRVLILFVCYGVLGERGVADRWYSLLTSLLNSPTIGAVIATWGVIAPSHNALRTLYRALATSGTLGSAVAKFNRSADAAQSNVTFAVFGDPGIRLSSSTRTILKKLTIAPKPCGKASTRREQRTAASDIAFLSSYMTNAALNCPESLLPIMNVALQQAETYKHLLLNGMAVEGFPSSPGPPLRKALTEFLIRRGVTISIDWLNLAECRRKVGLHVCQGCNANATRYRAPLRGPGSHARELIYCGNCGVIRDAPWGFSAALIFDGDRKLSIAGDVPNGWSATLRLGSQNDSESRGFPWPIDPSGSLHPSFDIPSEGPQLVNRLSLILMRGASLAVLSAPARNSMTTVEAKLSNRARATS